jgi:hypothetical protein
VAFIPIRNYQAPGRYPATEHQARHIFRNLEENGLGPAFTKVQGRVLFDPDRLEQLLGKRAEGGAGVR